MELELNCIYLRKYTDLKELFNNFFPSTMEKLIGL